MAIINKNSITFNDTKPFNGLAVNAPLVVDNGADGSYAVAAHQIYWGNAFFNGSYLLNGTTEALLSAIEDACAGFNSYYIDNVIKEYIENNGSYFTTDNELNEGLSTYYNKIMNDVSSYYVSTISYYGSEQVNTTENTTYYYYISNIDIVQEEGTNDYKISYTYAPLPSTEIVASALWEDYKENYE